MFGGGQSKGSKCMSMAATLSPRNYDYILNCFPNYVAWANNSILYSLKLIYRIRYFGEKIDFPQYFSCIY